jgi:hypothetical protein
MSTPTTAASACSCRLPWVLAALAVLGAGATLLAAVHQVPPPPIAVAPAIDAQTLAALRHELEETRRVLNDAQSALGDRDREIAAANDELRRLREAGHAKTP